MVGILGGLRILSHAYQLRVAKNFVSCFVIYGGRVFCFMVGKSGWLSILSRGWKFRGAEYFVSWLVIQGG